MKKHNILIKFEKLPPQMEKMFCQNKNFGLLKMTFEVNFLRQPPFLIFLKMFYMTPVLKAIFHVDIL